MKPEPPLDPARARLLERCHGALDHGDRRRARRIADKLARDTTDAPLAFLRWRIDAAGDDLELALSTARAGSTAYPDDPDLQHAAGWTLMELGRFEDALPYLEEACYLDADFADAWHDLAMSREATGDRSGMRRAFEEVYALDTAEPLPPLAYSEERVMTWATRALEGLPAEIRNVIGDLPIFVEPYPAAWITEHEPWDPRLLGLFDGPTWADLRSGEGFIAGSPHVYLFHRNLERVCPDAREMAEQVRITLHHEVGHFLGLDEHDLHQRGLG